MLGGNRRGWGARAAALALIALALPAAATAAEQLEYRVITPPGYASSTSCYPVVYIVPGSGEAPPSAIQKLELEKYAARGEAIVVVASEVGNEESNFIVDWFDGSKPLDTSFVRQLIPEVDARYRTLADGDHRAIAGYSAGGYSSMAIASRHPALFASAASFSGVTDLQWRGPAGQLVFEGQNSIFFGPETAFRRWGNPATDEANWAKQNPASLAARLRGKRGLYIASGDGTPASPEEAAAAGPGLGPQASAERDTGEMTASYHRKLNEAGVEHVYRPHAGLHRSSHWREDLALWWPMTMAAMPARDCGAAQAPLRLGIHVHHTTLRRRVLRHGIRVGIRPNRVADVRAVLQAPVGPRGALAKLASAESRSTPAGRMKLKLAPTRAGRRHLARRGAPIAATIRVTATSGRDERVSTRSVLIR